MTANSPADGRGDVGRKAILRSYFLNRLDGPGSGRSRQFGSSQTGSSLGLVADEMHNFYQRSGPSARRYSGSRLTAQTISVLRYMIARFSRMSGPIAPARIEC
jgi:hypothetical protein